MAEYPGTTPVAEPFGSYRSLLRSIDSPLLRYLEGYFSAGSTPIFATKYSFCSDFRDLQDIHLSAALETQNFADFRQPLGNFRTKNRDTYFTKFHQLLKNLQDMSLPETLVSQAFMGLEFGEIPPSANHLVQNHINRCVSRYFAASGFPC